ncbi:MAG: invasion associated locus B family protein [Pseudomonadota bacterium]
MARFKAFSAALVFAAAAANTVWAAPKDGEVFKDWTVRCETIPASAKVEVEVAHGEGEAGGAEGDAKSAAAEGGTTLCQIVQTLNEKSSGQPIMQVSIGYLPESEQPVAVFTLPLGVWLPPGIELKVDEGQAGRVPFDTCTETGCRAGVELDEKILGQMKQGEQLNLTFGAGARQPATVPVSLQGFTAALSSLK